MSHPVVRVSSRRAPAITWTCPSCHGPRLFDCSERFRANTNGKVVDIWSIYRCRVCDATKNITIVERTPVRRVPRLLLLAAENNDATLARRFARDVALLGRNGASVGEGDDWEVDNGKVDARASGACTLVFEEPLLVRLDAVAAAALGVARRHVADHVTVRASHRIDALRLWSDRVELRDPYV